MTSRGLGKPEFLEIGQWIFDVLDNCGKDSNSLELIKDIRMKSYEMCCRFPLYI